VAALAVAAAGCGSSASKPPAAKGHKGGVFTILANSSFGTADPAQNYTLEEWQLLIMTHDGLVGFAHEGGAADTHLVPDLATSIPKPTDGGKTYVFGIRRGIKFSDGQVLKPSDFVRTFERQYTVPGPTTFYSSIIGACKPGAKSCPGIAKGVVANDSAYTLTIHLTAADPEFLDKPRTMSHREPGRTCGSPTIPPARRFSSATPTSTYGTRRRSQRATRTRSSRSTACRYPTR
jgi:peptide/nickel transport system substrate-binding protein